MHKAYILLDPLCAGAEGYLQTGKEGTRLCAKGLSPGSEYIVIALSQNGAEIACRCTADAHGKLTCACKSEGDICVTQAHDGKALLQTGDDRMLAWRAQQAAKQEMAKAAQRDITPVAQIVESEDTDAIDYPAVVETSANVEEEIVREVEPAPDSHAYLYAQPAAPPVCALPALRWPSAASSLRVYFETLQPFAAFDAPGWRFVRVPMQRLGFCALGMRAQDNVVRQVAYAVPGARADRPPPGLHGYRWQAGLDGTGYWTLWKNAE